MGNRITISGRIVAEPELKVISDTFRVLQVVLYDNEQRKNRDTGEYEDTGNVTKLRVELKNELADEWNGKISKGDVIEIEGTIREREYDRSDGTKGRSLETSFVNSVTVKFKKEGSSGGGDGFTPEDNGGDGW